jgi:hypothetical protein
MPLMLVGDQRRFLTFEDEKTKLAELEEIYKREAAWRLEQSHLALARRRPIPQRPRGLGSSFDGRTRGGHEP